MVIIGSYKDVADMNAQYNAYLKYLTASSNIQRMNTEAFKEKLERGDAPVTRGVEEMDVYKNQQEKLLDTQAQKKKARENISQLFKRASDINTFLSLLEGETSIDPLFGETLGNPFTLFNVYFDELKDKTKRFVGLTPELLMKYYKRILDEQKEDLLPKKIQLDSIKGALDRISTQNLRLRRGVADIQKDLRSSIPSEKQLNTIADILNDTRLSDSEKLERAKRMMSEKSLTSLKAEARDEELNSLTVPQLQELLKGYNIRKGLSGKNKEQLIQMVKIQESPKPERMKTRQPEQEEEKKEEVVGSGVVRRGRPRRIVGGGVEVVKRDVDWYNAGVYRISRPLLEKNLLSVYYNKSLGRPNISQLKQTIEISDELKTTLKKLLKSGELHLPSFYKMTKSDQALLMKMMKSGKMIDVLEEAFGAETPKIHSDEVEEALHRFKLIQGQINAGQNNPLIIKELVKHVDTLHDNGLLSDKDRVNILKTILSL